MFRRPGAHGATSRSSRPKMRAREELLPLARDRAQLEIASFAAGRAELIDVIEAKTALGCGAEMAD